MSRRGCLHVAFVPCGKDGEYEFPATKYLSPKSPTITSMAATDDCNFQIIRIEPSHFLTATCSIFGLCIKFGVRILIRSKESI